MRCWFLSGGGGERGGREYRGRKRWIRLDSGARRLLVQRLDSEPTFLGGGDQRERLERQPAGTVILAHLYASSSLSAPFSQGRVVDALAVAVVMFSRGDLVRRVDEPMRFHVGCILVIAFDDVPSSDFLDLSGNPGSDFWPQNMSRYLSSRAQLLRRVAGRANALLNHHPTKYLASSQTLCRSSVHSTSVGMDMISAGLARCR